MSLWNKQTKKRRKGGKRRQISTARAIHAQQTYYVEGTSMQGATRHVHNQDPAAAAAAAVSCHFIYIVKENLSHFQNSAGLARQAKYV